jgi:hypothetical protein
MTHLIFLNRKLSIEMRMHCIQVKNSYFKEGLNTLKQTKIKTI